MLEGIEYPQGATPLDPDELGGLKFRHITTLANSTNLSRSISRPAYDG
jgi:hypothetical protein